MKYVFGSEPFIKTIDGGGHEESTNNDLNKSKRWWVRLTRCPSQSPSCSWWLLIILVPL
jgi:hypothetical protein